MTGVIIVALAALMTPTIANFVGKARETSDKQTLTVLNDTLNYYKTQGGDVGALTVGTPYANLLSQLRTPVSWAGANIQFLASNIGPYDNAITVEAKGSGNNYSITRYNTYDQGGGTAVLAGGEDMTNPEFNIAGATYYAVAEAGYSYSSLQDSKYGARKYNTLAAAKAAFPTDPTTPLVINILGSWSSPDTTGVYISGINTSASNYILVRTLGDAKPSEIRDPSAYRLEASGSFSCTIGITRSHVTLVGIQATNSASNANQVFLVDTDNNTDKVNLIDCIAYDSGGTSSGFHFDSGASVVNNSIAVGCGGNGFYVSAHSIGTRLYATNCIAAANGEAGFYVRDYRSIHAKNCYAGGNDGGDYLADPNATLGLENSHADDASGNVQTAYSSSSGAKFFSVSSGVENFHIDPTSALKGAGGDYSANSSWAHPSGSVDIDGDVRTAPWSVGVDQ